MWSVKYCMMTHTSLRVTTSDFSNLANNGFLFEADLLIWLVAGNFRRGRSVRADRATSQWDKERSQCYPSTPGVPEGLSETQGKQQDLWYYHSSQEGLQKIPQGLSLFKHLKIFQQSVLPFSWKKTLHRVILGTHSSNVHYILSGSCHNLAFTMRKWFIWTWCDAASARRRMSSADWEGASMSWASTCPVSSLPPSNSQNPSGSVLRWWQGRVWAQKALPRKPSEETNLCNI